MRHTLHNGLLAISAAVLLLVLAGCGGGGAGSVAGGGIGGTGITSGSITGFGSVFVNGIEFETGGSTFDVDDNPTATEGDLGIGMVVTIVGTVNKDGVSGTADSIVYDDELEGPVAADPVEDADMLTKTFDVFDTTVVVGRNTTVFENTDYETLARDDIVEVSGFFDGTGKLLATRLEKEGVLGVGSEVEVKGTVSGCGGDCIGAFSLGTLFVTYDGSTDLSEVPGGVIRDGQYLEVKGLLTPPSDIAATRIELEDEGFEDTDDDVSIDGIVSNFNGLSDFEVGGQAVNAATADFLPASLATTIANGDRVEVEGPIAGGVLAAFTVQQRGGDIKVAAIVASTNLVAGSVTLTIAAGQPQLTVFTDEQTQKEDERDDVEDFGLDDVGVGDYLEIEAYPDGAGGLVATRLQRDDIDDIVLQGPTDAAPATSDPIVSILGIAFDTTALGNDFEDENDNNIGRGVFFSRAEAGGELVKIKDNDPGDGLPDEVEFED